MKRQIRTTTENAVTFDTSSLRRLALLTALLATSAIASAQSASLPDAVATQVAAGVGHTCALTTAGAVQCWGWNRDGQLGNNSTTSSPVPVAVSGLGSGVVTIAVGDYHTCAVTLAGGAQCWGNNHYGELGNNSTTDSPVPVAVSGLASGVAAIGGGGAHTCALTTAGAVKCWGLNAYGQLGNNSTTDSPVPVVVTGLGSGVVAIAVGEYHTCALTAAGGAQCWGRNLYGRLGNGTTTDSQVPVAVTGLSSGVAAIGAGGVHTCALTTAGGAQCWGWNLYGELGDNSTTDSPVPVAVSGLGSGVMAITAGYGHTCALTTAGGAQCWGWNPYGQLGNNSTTNSSVPVAVSGLASGVVAIMAGYLHNCTVTTAGAVLCWGSNSFGQLGNNSTTDSHVPVAVSGFLGSDPVFVNGFDN